MMVAAPEVMLARRASFQALREMAFAHCHRHGRRRYADDFSPLQEVLICRDARSVAV